MRAQRSWPARACPLEYKASDAERIVDFHGYHYTRTPSDVSGALMTRYDESQPETWKLRLFDDVQPKVTTVAPLAGYLVPAEYAARVGALLCPARRGVPRAAGRAGRAPRMARRRGDARGQVHLRATSA
jgi:hypothetical protein